MDLQIFRDDPVDNALTVSPIVNKPDGMLI